MAQEGAFIVREGKAARKNHQNGRVFKGEGGLIQVNNYYFYCLNELQGTNHINP